MIAPSSSDAIAVRVRIVEEHVSLENAHNLDGIMGTFGEATRYDDEPWMPITSAVKRFASSTANCYKPCPTCTSISSGGTWVKMPSSSR